MNGFSGIPDKIIFIAVNGVFVSMFMVRHLPPLLFMPLAVFLPGRLPDAHLYGQEFVCSGFRFLIFQMKRVRLADHVLDSLLDFLHGRQTGEAVCFEIPDR